MPSVLAFSFCLVDPLDSMMRGSPRCLLDYSSQSTWDAVVVASGLHGCEPTGRVSSDFVSHNLLAIHEQKNIVKRFSIPNTQHLTHMHKKVKERETYTGIYTSTLAHYVFVPVFLFKHSFSWLFLKDGGRNTSYRAC